MFLQEHLFSQVKPMHINPMETANRVREIAWGDKGFPVDSVAIAKSFAINVIQTKLPDDISGALIKEAGKDPMIVVHFSDSNNRKRFTCAHELGHYILRAESKDTKDIYDYIDFRDERTSQGTDEDEIFANRFAANLLMPEQEIRKLYKRKSTYLEMGQYFGVSVEAIKIRLSNLGLL